MKRDMDLVRGILLGIEELDNNGNGCGEMDLGQYLKDKGYDTNGSRVYGHCHIMA